MRQKKLQVSFMPANNEDIQLIFAQSKALVDTYENTAAIPYDKVMHWLEEKIRQNISEYVKVCMDNETVGFYRLSNTDGETELDDFYILPAFRGQGIGTEVLKKCILEANAPMFLYVFKKNEGAIRLYKRFGFEPAQDVSESRMILRREG